MRDDLSKIRANATLAKELPADISSLAEPYPTDLTIPQAIAL